MANDQSETPVASAPETETKAEAPAAAVEAGHTVEAAVAASSSPAYTAPTDAHQAEIENDLFGDEAEHVVEPTPPATGEPGKKYVPESIVGGHP
ncbi:hypothetical protein [Streptomyces sp. NRRL S-350]|uniref:hypothetical protein n=1 Tax=Streptomyces sp. NRRL S-350 TaxID=1463902 RepID=UPI0004C159E9|nr:hypothetical protein [Streptomyces sp. NRRL S-350]